jgi:hypothetical protein
LGGVLKGGETANMGIDDRLEEFGKGRVAITLSDLELRELRATMPLQSWPLACHSAMVYNLVGGFAIAGGRGDWSTGRGAKTPRETGQGRPTSRFGPGC